MGAPGESPTDVGICGVQTGGMCGDWGFHLDRLSLRRPRHAAEISSRQLAVPMELGETTSFTPSVCTPVLLASLNGISAWQQRDGDLTLLWARDFLPLKSSCFGDPEGESLAGTRHTLACFSSFVLPMPQRPPLVTSSRS